MNFLTVWIYMCNVFDYIYTVYGMYKGWLTEGNPVMGYMFKYPILAFAYKIVGVWLALLFLWHYRKNTYAKIGLVVLGICYTVIVFYEIVSAFIIAYK